MRDLKEKVVGDAEEIRDMIKRKKKTWKGWTTPNDHDAKESYRIK